MADLENTVPTKNIPLIRLQPGGLGSQLSPSLLDFKTDDLEHSNVYPNGYNLGDLLGMPALYLSEDQLNSWHQKFYLERCGRSINDIRKLMIATHPLSALRFYFQPDLSGQMSDDAARINIPNVDRLSDAIQQYSDATDLFKKYRSLIDFISREDVLSVHLRCGDTSIESNFDERHTFFVKRLASRFRHVVVFTGLHPGFSSIYGYDKVKDSATQHVHRFLGAIEEGKGTLFIDGTVDDHIAIFQHAKHLALHRGGVSQILSLLNPNNIYLDLKGGWWRDKTTGRWLNLIRGTRHA